MLFQVMWFKPTVINLRWLKYLVNRANVNDEIYWNPLQRRMV